VGALELVREELKHITLEDAPKHLAFRPTRTWRKSAVIGVRRAPYFISTKADGPGRLIRMHQDGGSSGKPRSFKAASLPRTVLSWTNAAESPTATLARREMQSWRLLQLEPSSLREPDSFTAPTRLGEDGAHLAAALYHLARRNGQDAADAADEEAMAAGLYSQVANSLSALIDDVREVWVDRDEKRELLTLYVKGRDGTPHPARALSDGTLRFLALTVLERNPDAKGLICLEEPENGIHPERIPAMLALLQDIVTDVNEPVGPDNPLRQVIVNTHSPAVVAQVPDDSLLVAELKEAVVGGRRFLRPSFGCLAGTWRVDANETGEVSRGKLLAYLNPVMSAPERPTRRVADRPDLQMLIPFPRAV